MCAAAQLLDNAEESGVTLTTQHNPSRLARLFAYVSTARYSSSSAKRWEAVHAAIQMLWDDSHALGRSVTVHQLDQLFAADPLALQSVLPQLVYYLLAHRGSPVASEVQSFLLRTCAASPAFGYELYWLLLAQPCRLEPESTTNVTNGSGTNGSGSLSRSGSSVAVSTIATDDLQANGSSSSQQGTLRSRRESCLNFVEELLALVEAALDLPNGSSNGGGSNHGGGAAVAASGSGSTLTAPGANGALTSSSSSQFKRELHLVETLTSISEQLRAVPVDQRLSRLRSALAAVNRLLPRVGGANVPAWRPFVPLARLDARDHTIVRFLEDEAFVLSTKERVPYLVFVEIVDADPATVRDHLSSMQPPQRSRNLSGVSPRSAAAGHSRVHRLSLAVSGAAGRAALFARRRNLSFERMPSPRRRARRPSDEPDVNTPTADTPGCGVHVDVNADVGRMTDGGVVPLSTSSQEASPTSDGPPLQGFRKRSNSDPEVSQADAASAATAAARNGTPPPAPEPPAPVVVVGSDDVRMEDGEMSPPSEPSPNTPLRPAAEEANNGGATHQRTSSNGGRSTPNGGSGAIVAASDGSGANGNGGGAAAGGDDAGEEGPIDYTINEGFGELWEDRADRLRLGSAHSTLPGWGVQAFIVKSHDELLQEQFAVSLITEFERIFSHARLPLKLRPYRILATGPASGLIEVVPNAKSLDSVKKSTPNYFSLIDFFRRRYGGAASVSYHRARRNFCQSVAAYSVVSYLLQLKDRHNGNILLHADGSIVHIDFGFLLSNSPGKNMGFEAAPFKLTSEWVELMGGIGSPWFRYYSTLVVRGFQEARRHREKLLLIVQATYTGVDGQLPCFRAGQTALEAMRERFKPEMSPQQYARFAASLIDSSLDNWTTGAYDCYQRCCVGIL